MPSQSSRPARCVYKESGSRCIRNGAGNPALCGAHRIVFAEAGRRAATPPAPVRNAANAIGEIVDDFLHGRPFDPTKVASAVNEFAWGMGGGYTRYHPDITNDAPRFDPGAQQQPRERWAREAPPPEPVRDPAIERNARRTLGFGPSDPLTVELVKDRKRLLAKRHHPDRGGAVGRMAEINDAADVLIEAITAT